MKPLKCQITANAITEVIIHDEYANKRMLIVQTQNSLFVTNNKLNCVSFL